MLKNVVIASTLAFFSPTTFAKGKETAKVGATQKGKSVKVQRRSDEREQMIVREAKFRKSQKNINFEEALIQGDSVAPTVTNVSVGKSDAEFNLIQIRKSWHPEMVRSADNTQE